MNHNHLEKTSELVGRKIQLWKFLSSGYRTELLRISSNAEALKQEARIMQNQPLMDYIKKKIKECNILYSATLKDYIEIDKKLNKE